jgi:hypothetical protein
MRASLTNTLVACALNADGAEIGLSQKVVSMQKYAVGL